MLGFQSAIDHIIMVTDGITKVADHSVMEMLPENRVGGEPTTRSLNVWLRSFWVNINSCTLGLEVNKQSG